MYFPFFYARQSELLALRAMLTDHRSLQLLVPLLEPVVARPTALVKCIQEFGKEEQPLAVILNPDKHELKQPGAVAAWLEVISEELEDNQHLLPTFRCTSGTGFSEVNEFLKKYSNRRVAIAYTSPVLSDAQLKALAATANVQFHFDLSGMTTAQRALLPTTKRVSIRDYFNKLDRNSDYDGVELFTDRHKAFKPSWAGFGDYASIGSAFSATGGPPSAVAIHAIYKEPKSGAVWIEHFVSDDTVKDVGSIQGKFVQAAKKLTAAAKSRPKQFGKNFALDEFALHASSDHFPGLPKNKELQISHHICLMLDVLGDAV